MGGVIRFPRPRRRRLSPEQARAAAERMLAMPIAERAEKASELLLEEPDVLLALCGRLKKQLDSSPVTVRDDAEFLYRYLEKPKREIGLLEERDYFLGETALIAATACRHLSM